MINLCIISNYSEFEYQNLFEIVTKESLIYYINFENYIKDLNFHYVTDMRDVIKLALLDEKVSEPLDLTVKEETKPVLN